MNPLTQIKNTQKATQREITLGLGESASWHARFKHSAYIYAGGLDFDLTEGDLLAVFAQYGEIVDVNLVRDKTTGKSRGFAFLAYVDQRSTVLAVDNLNGATVAARKIRVEHVDNYKKRKAEIDGEEPGDPAQADAAGSEAAAAAPAELPSTSGRWQHDKYSGPPDKEPAAAHADNRAPRSGAGGVGDAWAGPNSLFSLLAETNANTGSKDRRKQPADLRLEVETDEEQTGITYDDETKTVHIPLSIYNDGARRTKLVMFTCNRCGGRSARLVNPIAWEKGLVFGQCQHCEVWHTLASNNPKLLEEIRYNEESDSGDSSSESEPQTQQEGAEV
eukprot:jgi/Chrzof1/11296/Cz05g31140.t1